MRGAKCLSGWCGVPDADMTCLILGGGRRGADVSLPVVEVLLPAPVRVLVPVVWLCVPERAVRLGQTTTTQSTPPPVRAQRVNQTPPPKYGLRRSEEGSRV